MYDILLYSTTTIQNNNDAEFLL